MANVIFENVKFLVFIGILSFTIIAIGMAFSDVSIATFGGFLLVITILLVIIGIIIEVKD